jgi:hypothetical protein
VSEWRRRAMQMIPYRAKTAEQATSLHALWFELLSDFQAAYRDRADLGDRIEPIWAFAAWCLDAKRNKTVRNAVAVSFYEHLAHFGPARRELPQRLTRARFEELLPAFGTVLEDTEYDAFVSEMLRAYGAKAGEMRRYRRAAT